MHTYLEPDIEQGYIATAVLERLLAEAQQLKTTIVNKQEELKVAKDVYYKEQRAIGKAAWLAAQPPPWPPALMSVTRVEVEEACQVKGLDMEEFNMVVEDVLRMVNDGYRYPPRGNTEEFRIPEDISTEIAKHFVFRAPFEKVFSVPSICTAFA